MEKQRKPENTLGLRRGEGSIAKKTGSSCLYFDFTYFGERVKISTGLIDSPENRKKALRYLMSFRAKMDNGAFKFCEVFPEASPRLKALFAAKEGFVVTAQPQDVTFGEFITLWYEDVWKSFRSDNAKHYFKQVIERWILPFFCHRSFIEVDSSVVGEFIRSLVLKKGENKGRPLRRGSIRKILIPLQTLWNDACDKYRWHLPTPFARAKSQMPQEDAEISEMTTNGPMGFDDYMCYLRCMDPWYQPVAELAVLTGMRLSEMADITISDIRDGYLLIRSGKARSSRRKIPVTSSIQRVLDVLVSRAGMNSHLVTSKSGEPFRPKMFIREWGKAVKTGMPSHHRRSYVLRQSFTAWALILGIDLYRLTTLLGLKSVEIRVPRYCYEGLERDSNKIRTYFGEDFIDKR